MRVREQVRATVRVRPQLHAPQWAQLQAHPCLAPVLSPQPPGSHAEWARVVATRSLPGAAAPPHVATQQRSPPRCCQQSSFHLLAAARWAHLQVPQLSWKQAAPRSAAPGPRPLAALQATAHPGAVEAGEGPSACPWSPGPRLPCRPPAPSGCPLRKPDLTVLLRSEIQPCSWAAVHRHTSLAKTLEQPWTSGPLLLASPCSW
mmetsp:Transcript_28554/g.66494  ORF Transcript_28554/g.66494 Transcript_28554/m.66494 type:complete len:203 (+) Transcript_28554:436-1044(+)